MTTGQRTIAGLLTAVVVLLGLNLAATMTRTAHAQQGFAILPRVTGVATTGGTTSSHYVYRCWSDGTVERNKFCHPGVCSPVWSGWELVPD